MFLFSLGLILPIISLTSLHLLSFTFLCDSLILILFLSSSLHLHSILSVIFSLIISLSLSSPTFSPHLFHLPPHCSGISPSLPHQSASLYHSGPIQMNPVSPPFSLPLLSLCSLNISHHPLLSSSSTPPPPLYPSPSFSLSSSLLSSWLIASPCVGSDWMQ